jgi:hypothetical protein
MPTKICSECKQPKELDEFARRPETKDGRSTKCKACEKKKVDRRIEARREFRELYF